MALLRRSLTGAAALAASVAAAVALTPGAGAGQQRGTPNTLTRDSTVPPPRATVHDVAWLAGAWEADAFGGVLEEVWSPPSAGTMVGMFKLRQGDSVAFYELMIVAALGESLVLRLKHFTPTLAGWEEKDEAVNFPLVRLDSDAAHFDGLSFVRLHPDTLRVFLRMGRADGSMTEQRFLYRRVR